MTAFKESNKKISDFLTENDFGIMELTMYLDTQGYVTIVQHEFDKLEEV